MFRYLVQTVMTIGMEETVAGTKAGVEAFGEKVIGMEATDAYPTGMTGQVAVLIVTLSWFLPHQIKCFVVKSICSCVAMTKGVWTSCWRVYPRRLQSLPEYSQHWWAYLPSWQNLDYNKHPMNHYQNLEYHHIISCLFLQVHLSTIPTLPSPENRFPGKTTENGNSQ